MSIVVGMRYILLLNTDLDRFPLDQAVNSIYVAPKNYAHFYRMFDVLNTTHVVIRIFVLKLIM